LCFRKVLSIGVVSLNLVPIMLPVVFTESFVVFKSVNEEITVSYSVVYGESSCVSDGIRVWRELSALKEEGTGKREFD